MPPFFYGKEDILVEEKKPDKRISVRSLVEFILRHGDITSSRRQGRDVNAMQEGARLHRKLQKQGGSQYQAEVGLRLKLDLEFAMLTIEGRADGIMTGPLPDKLLTPAMREQMQEKAEEYRDLVTIDEIKCMYRGVLGLEEPEELHLAQAKCYAYLYAREHGQKRMMVQITYVQIAYEKIKRFWYEYSYEELEKWFLSLVFSYSRFLEFELKHFEAVRQSAKACAFPFEYRKGQRELAAMVYTSMKRKEPLYAQAPTGVGKTMSTVFPAVKAMGEGLADKIFYLTAKTITRTVAEEAFVTLRERGLTLSFVTISARDKLCVMEERNCNPEYCPRAKGHYDRVNECLYDLLTQESSITRELIELYAESYRVCPYELSLDVAVWVDAVICDYNYVFDPKVRLKRFFSEQAVHQDYLFLVDEAHNLIERGRMMYSASISLQDVELAAGYLKALPQAFAGQAYHAVLGIEHAMQDYQTECREVIEEEHRKYLTMSSCNDVCFSMLRFLASMEEMLEEHTDFEGVEELMQFYFTLHHFVDMYENLDEHYVIYVEPLGYDHIELHLFCVNPSHCLQEVLEKGRSTIFFSATMLPIAYYKELLTGNQQDKAVYIPSPFEKKNRFLAMTRGVTSKYTDRNYEQYERIVEYLKVATKKPGNYMVFFSSYKMMEDVYDVALMRGLSDGRRMRIQEANMREEERERFLLEFREESDRPLVAFCILGGIFSEGIDLKEDQLIGAFIVGNGLPQICNERDVLHQYFKERGMDGFAYAYIYPAMNKVLQAAGRVIRTEQDRGVILLMDDRFQYGEYKSLFPMEWDDCQTITLSDAERRIGAFWKQTEQKEE